ncbi:MAG: hypothetical protein Q4B43_03910 [Bacteroidota bacterium]|nr:hypothetical protein [Bacteroidota bacterium]
MKRYFCILFLIIYNLAFCQNFYLNFTPEDSSEQKQINNLIYNKLHKSPKTLDSYTKQLSDSLHKQGFLQNRINFIQKTNDSTFVYELWLGKKINSLKIYTSDSSMVRQLNIIESDTITIEFQNIQPFLNEIVKKLEHQGYATSKIQLTKFRQQNDTLLATLSEEIDFKRVINDLVVVGYGKFPKGILKNLKKKYRHQTFNNQTTTQLTKQIQKYNFVNISKAPEVLFTNQATRIFLYLEKKQANTFDGYIGFGNNNDSKISFNGYVDLHLKNILNAGEDFKIYWKNDGSNQETINIEGELPYLFQTPFALKPKLNIFKQDSTFQTTKSSIDLGYYLNYNTRIYLGYHNHESNSITQNINAMEDFTSKFLSLSTTYFFTDNNYSIFPLKTKINFKTGFGNRTTEQFTTQQYYIELNGHHNVYLNSKNSINTRLEAYYLHSNQYLTNEMYRTGGIHSIRGFRENSLQANIFYSLQLEYRYLLNPTLYVHSISDIGYLIDYVNQQKHQLYGIGFGFGIFTKNGLFHISYANGRQKNVPIKLSNSIVHLSFKTTF